MLPLMLTIAVWRQLSINYCYSHKAPQITGKRLSDGDQALLYRHDYRLGTSVSIQLAQD